MKQVFKIECSCCRIIKPITEFNKSVNSKYGVDNTCKECAKDRYYKFKHSKVGLISIRYSRQKTSSKQRGHKPPKYSLEELKVWALEQDIFHKLYKNWKRSGFKQELSPSFDRLDDSKRYNLKRLQIVTWKENSQKPNAEIKLGKAKGGSKSVIAISKETLQKFKFHSIKEAKRQTGVATSSISNCCNNKNGVTSAGGFIWKFLNKKDKSWE